MHPGRPREIPTNRFEELSTLDRSSRSTADHAGQAAETVVLVHGYLAHRLWLSLLERRLRHQGFHTLNWGYPSLFQSLREHAARLREDLFRLDNGDDDGPGGSVGALHLVTHSMGGIVARAALEAGAPRRLRRIVMLGTPNAGSEVARRLAPFLGRLSPPIRELSNGQDGLVHAIGMPEGLEIGVLSARYDVLVSQVSARPQVPHHHVSINCSHSGLVLRKDAARHVVGFLRTGRFSQDSL